LQKTVRSLGYYEAPAKCPMPMSERCPRDDNLGRADAVEHDLSCGDHGHGGAIALVPDLIGRRGQRQFRFIGRTSVPWWDEQERGVIGWVVHDGYSEARRVNIVGEVALWVKAGDARYADAAQQGQSICGIQSAQP
jgi:hypothetical protein